MLQKLQLSLLLMFFTFVLKGQSIEITKVQGETGSTICLGKKVSVSYNITGSFNLGNTFKIQVKSSNVDNWVNLDTKDSSGYLLAVLPTNINGIQENYDNYGDFRVSSSSPAISSQRYAYWNIYTPANVEIMGIKKNVLYPNEPVSMSFKYSGSVPISLLMIDSLSIHLNGYGNRDDVIIATQKAGNYEILNVRNICGVGQNKGGSVNLRINENRLKIIGVSNSIICKNGTLAINVAKLGKWADGNKFILRLKNNTDASKTYDFDATVNGDIFSCKVDGNIPKAEAYQAKVISSDGVESEYTDVSISIMDEVKAELTVHRNSIKYGDANYLTMNVSGYGRFSVELSDGQTYHNNFLYAGNNELYFRTYPRETTEYYIKSFTSVCGTVSGKNKVLVTVNPGIIPDTLKASKVCEGSTFELVFRTNSQIKVGSNINVKLSNNNYFPLTDYVEVIGQVIRENVVSFIIPYNLRNTFRSPLVYINLSTDEIQSETFTPNAIIVNSKPSGNISIANGVENLKSPQFTDIDLILKGGTPYVITLSDSLKYRYDEPYTYWETNARISVFTPKTTNFLIKSISNACGTNNSTSSYSKYVTVENNDKLLQLVSSDIQQGYVCAGQKIVLSLITKGNFGTDNQFILELLGNDFEVTKIKLGTISQGKTEITIPADLAAGKYFLRVTSNNPQIYSNRFEVMVNAVPVASFSIDKETNTYGETNLNLNITGGDTIHVVFKDGTKETIKNFYYLPNSLNYRMKLDKTTTFGVTSISNSCGMGIVKSKDFTITAFPYKIFNQLDRYKNGYDINGYCIANQFMVPFEIEGVLGDDVLSVQMSKVGDSVYTTIGTNIRNTPALVTLPNTFKDGNYNVRFVNKDNTIQSDIAIMNLRSVPDSKLQLLNGGSDVTINAGDRVDLLAKNSLNLYSSSRLLISDDKNNKIIINNNANNTSISKYPTENIAYRLISATNECGLGTVSGTVKVTVKPVLNMGFNSINNSYCIGTSTDIRLSSIGPFEMDNTFKVYVIDDNDVKTELLKTTKNGEYALLFPNSLERGIYKVFFESSNPSLSKNIGSISLNKGLDFTLIGNLTINSGNGVFIALKNNDPYKPKKVNSNYSEMLDYELSNGKTGSIVLSPSNSQPYIFLYPTKTETYTLKSVKNICGLGKVDGSATVTVNPPSNKQVNIYNTSSYSNTFCMGSTVNVYFSTLGAFSVNNKFTVQLSDKNGANFKNLVTEGTESPLKVKIPTDLVPNTGFSMRVIASDTNTTSITSNIPLTILTGISARFDTSSYQFDNDKPVSIGIKFVGTPPFTFAIGSDEVSAKSITVNTNDYVLTVNPTANTVYRLFSVSNNVCGTGTVLSPSTVRIELITGTDELGKMGINIFPNPASDVLNIESNDKELDVQLIDFTGKIIQVQTLRGVQKQVDLSKIPSGTYFLNVQKDGRKATFKVLKQ